MPANLSLCLAAAFALAASPASAGGQTASQGRAPSAAPLILPVVTQTPAATTLTDLGPVGGPALGAPRALETPAAPAAALGSASPLLAGPAAASAAAAPAARAAASTVFAAAPVPVQAAPAGRAAASGVSGLSVSVQGELTAAGEIARAPEGSARGLGERLEVLMTGESRASRADDLGAPAAVSLGDLAAAGGREGRTAPVGLAPAGTDPAFPDAPRGPSGPRSGGGGDGTRLAPGRELMAKVYGWMAGGLALSGLTAWAMSATGAVLVLAHSPALLIGLAVAEIAVVLALTFGLRRMSGGAATAGFFLYAGLTGASLSPILLVYTTASIAASFFVTAGMFGAMALYGHFTKRDLTGIGVFGLMALIGIILASLVNFFLKSPVLDMALTYLTVLVFVGLTAFDAQKIRQLAAEIRADDREGLAKAAVIGALNLYLDFINLFLAILKILGKRRKD